MNIREDSDVLAMNILIRELRAVDCLPMAQAFSAQGWHKPVEQFERYLAESQSGQRTALIAEVNGQFAGYLTIVWHSDYPPFRKAGIPEIVDFNVLVKFQRQGLGSRLMDEAEQRIAVVSATAGIGVGLTADYGAAQILYIRRGYVPDGRGAFSNIQPLCQGEYIRVDDSLALYMTKEITQQIHE